MQELKRLRTASNDLHNSFELCSKFAQLKVISGQGVSICSFIIYSLLTSSYLAYGVNIVNP